MSKLPFGIQDATKNVMNDEPSVMDWAVLFIITTGTIACVVGYFVSKLVH